MTRLTFLLAICFSAGCAIRTGYTEVSRVGPRLNPHPADCPLKIFPSGPPPYSYEDIGYARTTCAQYSRNDCFIDLKRTACLSGADTVYGFNESVADHYTYLTATFARNPAEPTAAN
jgi:hypothetical protein